MYKLLVLLLAVFLASCGKGPVVAGSGSESSNALTGCALYNPNSTSTSVFPAAGADVKLFQVTPSADTAQTGYTWHAVDSTAAGSDGNFSFGSVKPGEYALIIQYQTKKAFSGYFKVLENNPLLALGYMELQNTKNIQGRISDTQTVSAAPVVIGLVGTPFADTVAQNGNFNLAGLPAGFYNLQLSDSLSGTLNSVLPVLPPLPVFDWWGATLAVHSTANNNVAVDAFQISVPWDVNSMTNFITVASDSTKLQVNGFSIFFTTVDNP
jgi:hypothetical protein